MSILIAYKKDGVVYMATDTRVIVNENKKNELCECNYKIQKMDNGMLVGITGDILTRQTIFANSEIFSLDKKGDLTRKHIVKEIIPKLINVLEGEELIFGKEDELPYMSAQILLAYKGELFEICSNFTIYKYEDFQALGSTSDYAEFTLASINEKDEVNEKITKALDIVAKNSQLVSRPYVLIDTKNLSYKLIREKDTLINEKVYEIFKEDIEALGTKSL